MQKYKIIAKYFLSEDYLRFSLRTKYFLVKQEMNNNEKLNNMAFLRFIKDYDISDKNDSQKLIDVFLNFRIEKYLFLNGILANIKNYFTPNVRMKPQILFDFIRFAITRIRKLRKNYKFEFLKNEQEQKEAFLTDLSGNNVLLYKFEVDFIKQNLRDKNNNKDYITKGLQVKKNKNIAKKKISHYQPRKNLLDENSNSFDDIKARRPLDTSYNSASPERVKKPENDPRLNQLNEYYYLKLLRELKKRENRFYARKINFNSELRYLQSRIRNKKMAKYKQFFKRIYKILNIKHLMDLKNTKNTIHEAFSVLSKYIALYKRSINELVEGQREVTHNKNFKFEDGETVKDKIENFEKKLKENVNLHDHFEKKDNKNNTHNR